MERSAIRVFRGQQSSPYLLIRNADRPDAGFIGANGQDLKLPNGWLRRSILPCDKRA